MNQTQKQKLKADEINKDQSINFYLKSLVRTQTITYPQTKTTSHKIYFFSSHEAR